MARQDVKLNLSGLRPSVPLNPVENMAANMKKITQHRLALEAAVIASKIVKRDDPAFKSRLEKLEGKAKEPAETRTKSLNENMLTLLNEHRKFLGVLFSLCLVFKLIKRFLLLLKGVVIRIMVW